MATMIDGSLSKETNCMARLVGDLTITFLSSFVTSGDRTTELRGIDKEDSVECPVEREGVICRKISIKKE